MSQVWSEQVWTHIMWATSIKRRSRVIFRSRTEVAESSALNFEDKNPHISTSLRSYEVHVYQSLHLATRVCWTVRTPATLGSCVHNGKFQKRISVSSAAGKAGMLNGKMYILWILLNLAANIKANYHPKQAGSLLLSPLQNLMTEWIHFLKSYAFWTYTRQWTTSDIICA
jgi:hypothetical protein